MRPVDLADVTRPPASPFEPFEFHGCDCGIASFRGEPPWELHTAGDELIHVLAGGTRLTVRVDGAEIVRQLGPGELAVVPTGHWHRNYAPDGVTLLHMTPKAGNQNSWEDPRYRTLSLTAEGRKRSRAASNVRRALAPREAALRRHRR